MSASQNGTGPTPDYLKVSHHIWDIDDLNPHQKWTLLYVMRHTWGYNEFEQPKRITIDEFQHGRKCKDGTRMDKGVGGSRGTCYNSVKALEEKGYILVNTDDSDAARIEKSYRLNPDNASVQNMNAAFNIRTQRSTDEHSVQNPLPERSLFERDQRKKPRKTLQKDTSERKDSAPEKSAAPNAANHDRLFNGIALYSFDIKKTEKVPRSAGARIGKVRKALLEIEPDCTPERLNDFYLWFQRKYPDINPPRDATKFAEHFTAFRQANVHIVHEPEQRRLGVTDRLAQIDDDLIEAAEANLGPDDILSLDDLERQQAERNAAKEEKIA